MLEIYESPPVKTKQLRFYDYISCYTYFIFCKSVDLFLTSTNRYQSLVRLTISAKHIGSSSLCNETFLFLERRSFSLQFIYQCT